ncbi:MAG: hypothetical protein LC772_09700, partial [Chloroflexi bacterium]|nr:hypothetical protein [Chloroflexota bacterium]
MNGWSWPHRVHQELKGRPPAARALRQNALLGLSCFGFAIILWMYVAGADPDQAALRDTIREIQVPLEHSPSSTMSIVEPSTRTVTVTIRSSSSWVPDRPGIRAWLDIARITSPGVHRLRVNISAPRDAGTSVSVTPDMVDALVDAVATRDTRVTFVGVKELPEGFSARVPTIDPDVVTITGPSSLLHQGKAAVSFDLSNMTENVDMLIPVHLSGVPDAYLHLFTIDPSRVRLFLPIQKHTEYNSLPVDVVPSGHPANGFIYRRAAASPNTVTVSGTPSVVLGMDGVPTAPVSLSGRRSSFTEQVSLSPPPGVSVAGSPTVRVHVQIAPEPASDRTPPFPPTPRVGSEPSPAGIGPAPPTSGTTGAGVIHPV